MLELSLALLFEFFGPVLLVILAIWAFILLRRGLRLKKSLAAGDETSLRMEQLRLKAGAIGFLALVLALAVLAVALVNEAHPQAAVLVAAATYGVMALWARSLKNRYNRDFKENVVATELARVFDRLHYRPEHCYSEEAIRELHFFKPFDSLRGSDFIEAEYCGLHFTQSDVSLLEKHDSHLSRKGRKRETRVNVFNGRVMRFDFADAFRGKVQVLRRDFAQARVSDDPEDWQSVETELAEFAEDFRIYALDPMDAMAVLTPRMIEGIHHLNKRLNVPIALYFIDKSMYVFIARARDAFDVSKRKTLLEEREALQQDIALITDFLDTMYFKKQAGSAPAAPERALPERARPELPRPERQSPPPPTSGLQDILRRLGYKVQRAGGLAGNLVFYVPLAAYLASAAYMLAAFPDTFAVSYSSIGEHVTLGQEVSTIGYLLVGSLFIIPSALAGGAGAANIIAALTSGSGSGLSPGARIASICKNGVSMLVIMIPCWIHLFFLNANILYR